MTELFAWNLHMIPEPDTYKITTFIYKVIKWDPTSNYLSKSDLNKLMVSIFKNKKSAKNAILSWLKLLGRFERLAYNKQNEEEGERDQLKREIDHIIHRITLVIKSDLNDVYNALSTHVENKEVSAPAFYTYLNQTAIKAIKHHKKWLYYLSINDAIKTAMSKSEEKVTDWLLRSDIGFSLKDFKKFKSDEKDKKLHSEKSKMISDLVLVQQNQSNQIESLIKMVNPNNSNQNHNNKPSKKFAYKQPVGYAQMMQDLNRCLKANGREMTFDKKYCAFWNHDTNSCRKGENCDRIHKCMNCLDRNHILMKCDKWGKNKNKNKKQ